MVATGPPCPQALWCPGCCPPPCTPPPAPTPACPAPRHTGQTKTCNSLLHFATAPPPATPLPRGDPDTQAQAQALLEATSPGWAASVRAPLLSHFWRARPASQAQPPSSGHWPGTRRERAGRQAPGPSPSTPSVASGPPVRGAGMRLQWEARAHIPSSTGQGVQAQGELLALPCSELGPSLHPQPEPTGPPLTTSPQSTLQAEQRPQDS